MEEKKGPINGSSGGSSSDFKDSTSVSSASTEEGERGEWSGKLDFILSCIGYAVGLGNVWRFPYKAYKNGGATFLIPYVIMLACAGLPLFFLELAFGQFASLGPVSIWRISPIFKGLGWAMVVISGLVTIYYNVIIAWTLFYLFASFTDELPWGSCNHEWNTCMCKERGQKLDLTSNSTNATVAPLVARCKEEIENYTLIANQTNTTVKWKSPSEEYWERYVLDISASPDDPGTIRWQLALCLLLAWIVIFLCLVKGIKSSGKVVYVTATFPYIILVILLIRGVTLDGAMIGINFYLVPEWGKLLEAEVWADAASQIFYSLGVAFGALHTMSSYNNFRNNCYRDALIVAITNCGTSVFAGFVIFSVLGFMSHETGVDIKDVAADGPGLAFVVYPEAMTKMPISPLWSILFFFMVFTLGLDSQFAMAEVVLSAVTDEFTYLRSKKIWLTLGLCVVGFFLGLPCVTNGGMYVFQIFDSYSAYFSLLIVALLECIVVSWVYGYNNFANDIHLMIGYRPNIYWRATWMVITPVMITFIIVFSAITYKPITYAGISYPPWGEALCWIFVVIAIIPIIVVAFVEYCKSVGFKKTMLGVIKPSADWGPANPAHRRDDPTGRYTDKKLNELYVVGEKNPGFSHSDEKINETTLDNHM